MPGNDATRKKSAGRTKIETINPNAGVLPFNLIQTFASGSRGADMRIAKQSEGQQQHRRWARNQPAPEQTGWAIQSCEAEFDYLRIHTADPDNCISNVVDVTSIDVTAEKFLCGGGGIVRPKIRIPGVGTMITCRDSIGQVFTFIEEEIPVNPEMPAFRSLNW
jgi:hypothetical protein